ncbi:DoxX family protein [Nocardioides kongjuensis]|uniref:Putative membrane protein n=1 Tax=Nocardioides kongjuensis TaxID=349522 RepID=A0A852RII2_9ACTN|nr:DoxX family protein [Nocardioides kongjuensis]NYD30359.1 putative membrane protein [Nocardioides kongjuensis]
MSVPFTAKAVTAAFAASGLVHLVRPQVFEPMIPEQLPAPRQVVVWSGVAELACAAGMLHPRTRRVAAYAGAALLVGVFPGNVKMALDAQRGDNTALKAGTLARLPLQLPMIRGMLKAAWAA